MLTLLVLQTEPWSDLTYRLGVLGRSASEAAVAVAVALVVMLVGWAVATLLARLVRSVLRALRFDDAMRRVAGRARRPGIGRAT